MGNFGYVDYLGFLILEEKEKLKEEIKFVFDKHIDGVSYRVNLKF